MKLAIFNHNGAQRIGIAPKGSSDGFIDAVAALGLSSSEPLRDMLSLISSSSEPQGHYAQLKQALARNDQTLAGARLDINGLKREAPLARPGKIICLAGNYREHIVESGYAAPQESAIITQQLFLKPSSAIIGDGDEVIIGENNHTVGWETELAVVIGKGGRNIPAESAYDHVFGYTILNDVSEPSVRWMVSSIGLPASGSMVSRLAAPGLSPLMRLKIPTTWRSNSTLTANPASREIPAI